MQAKVILKDIKGHPYLEYKTVTKRFNNALYFTFVLKGEFIEKIKQEKSLSPIFKDLIINEYNKGLAYKMMICCLPETDFTFRYAIVFLSKFNDILDYHICFSFHDYFILRDNFSKSIYEVGNIFDLYNVPQFAELMSKVEEPRMPEGKTEIVTAI